MQKIQWSWTFYQKISNYILAHRLDRFNPNFRVSKIMKEDWDPYSIQRSITESYIVKILNHFSKNYLEMKFK